MQGWHCTLRQFVSNVGQAIRLRYSQALVKEVREEGGGMGEVVRHRVRWQEEGAKPSGQRAVAEKAYDDQAAAHLDTKCCSQACCC